MGRWGDGAGSVPLGIHSGRTRWGGAQIRKPQSQFHRAFTTIYADGPYFAGAILAPCVLGADLEEFM